MSNIHCFISRKQLENLPSKQYLENNWNFTKEFRKTNDIQHDYFVMCIKNHKRAIEYEISTYQNKFIRTKNDIMLRL